MGDMAPMRSKVHKLHRSIRSTLSSSITYFATFPTEAEKEEIPRDAFQQRGSRPLLHPPLHHRMPVPNPQMLIMAGHWVTDGGIFDPRIPDY